MEFSDRFCSFLVLIYLFLLQVPNHANNFMRKLYTNGQSGSISESKAGSVQTQAAEGTSSPSRTKKMKPSKVRRFDRLIFQIDGFSLTRIWRDLSFPILSHSTLIFYPRLEHAQPSNVYELPISPGKLRALTFEFLLTICHLFETYLAGLLISSESGF